MTSRSLSGRTPTRQTGPVASRQVGTVTLPLAVAGHPALELCNTRAGWGEEAPREYLTTYRHLAVWARELGLLGSGSCRRLLQEAAADPPAAEQVLARALTLRDALYAGLTDPRSPHGALDAVTAELHRAAAAEELRRAPDGGLILAQPTAGVDLPLRLVATEVRRFVEAGRAGDVGRCPGAGCGWLFLREGRDRRWCTMALCGNRAKARRFAERRRTAGP